MKAPLIHVASMIFNEPLAISRVKLGAILAAIGPRLVVDDAALDELRRAQLIGAQPLLVDESATASSDITLTAHGDAVLLPVAQMPERNGNRQDDKPYRLTPEGIAVIPVRGTLMKRFSWITAASGCDSYASLQQAATAALGDPQVKAVLFDVNSPGGTTHGCFELSDALYQMRGDKPMWAVANDLAASAAYALASACDRVFVTRTGSVGSVGVFALHADMSGADEQAGIKYTYISAGDKKTDGNPHEPLTKSARGDIQAEVDREYGMFVQCVARNRGFAGANVEKIQQTEAAVFFGDNALPLLADEVASCDEALEALTAKVNGVMPQSSGKVALKTEPGNNASDDAKHELKGEPAMADIKRAKDEDAEAAAAAAQQDDEDEDDEEKKKPSDDEEAEGSKGKKGKKAADPKRDDQDSDDAPQKARRGEVTELPVAAANAPAKRIAELCQIAGAPELAAAYILKGYNVDTVIEKLSARRAKASAEGAVNSYVTGQGSSGSQVSVDQTIEQARVQSANSGGKLTPSQCMERLLRANPQIYEGYMNERDDVIARSPGGRGPALTNYVLNVQRRYMSALGLGTAIEDVPAHRSM